MAFQIADIKKLAGLSRLALTPQEIERMQHDLNDIVGYAERLQEVDVTGVAPMTHAVPAELPLRADEVALCVGRQGLLGSAGYEDGLVKVPKIIE